MRRSFYWMAWIPVAVMLHACSDGGDGQDTPADMSTLDVDAGSQPSTRVLVEGMAVPLSAGRSAPITFAVPDDALSLHVTVVGIPEEVYAITSWTQPDGSALVGPDWTIEGAQRMCVDCANRVLSNFGAVAAVAPNNPEVAVISGEHTLVIDGLLDDIVPEPSETVVTLDVIAKVGRQVPSQGWIDLNLHFTGAAGWSAATAPDDPTLRGLLDHLSEVYAQANVELGEIRYLDVENRFAVLSDFYPPLDMLEMLALVDPEASPGAINLFFVGEIAGGSLGVATIPGPALQGSPWSGVVIDVDGPDLPTNVLPHELGHFLGLWHINDAIGSDVVFDQLSDTADYDERQLMAPGGGGSEISAMQADVIRSSPWVRH